MIIAFISIGIFIIAILVGLLIAKQSQDAIWKRFAVEIGAEFFDGSLFRHGKVQARVKDSTITMDAYSVVSEEYGTTYTHITVPIQNADNFQFTILHTDVISKIGKAFGAQDIEIGDPNFDRDFTIQSNNELKMRALLANSRIRQLIQTQKSIRLMLTRNMLRFEVQGIIKDVEWLKSLLDLFGEVLGQVEG